MNQVTYLLAELCVFLWKITTNFANQIVIHTYMYQALECFCDTLKSIGEIWMGDDKFMAELDEDSDSKLHDDLKRYGTS